jgi:predicted nucleic acid-binding protein
VTARTSARRRGGRVRERASPYASANGPVVVDASMAAVWFTNEPDLRGAARLLETESMLLAPDLMAVEATNAWWKRIRRREMDLAEVEQAVTHLMALQIVWVAAATLLRPAARLAAELGHPVYDCVYLALAVSQSAALATADNRLRKGAERVGVRLWSPRR